MIQPADDSKPANSLPAAYIQSAVIDPAKPKTAVIMNLLGVGLLFVSGWVLSQIVTLLRPEFDSYDLFDDFGGTTLFFFLMALVGTLLVHELVHGFFFWIFTRERPKLGVHLLFAYAAAPEWYFPRTQYLVIGLSPLLLITLTGLLLATLIPITALPVLVLVLIFNFAGSTGDLYIISRLFRLPKNVMINDAGPLITLFEPAREQVARMSQRWLDLMASFEVDPEDARPPFANLVACYTGKKRFYHNLNHVEYVLDMVESLQELANDLPALQLAVWFHDVVYDARVKDNEVKSAEYARRVMAQLVIPAETINKASDMILATITHKAVKDIDTQILLDSDLSSLGADADTFWTQTNAIRQESGWIEEEVYTKSRAEFLTGFLERERIFHIDKLFRAREAQARRNIQSVLDRLNSSG